MLSWGHMPWIEEESLERKSAALVCKRLRGSHTFDILAGALDNVHWQYKIRGKVVRTTTDSGSSSTQGQFKAFHMFGEQNDPEESEEEADPDALDLTDHIDYNDASAILDEEEISTPPSSVMCMSPAKPCGNNCCYPG